MFKAVGIVLVGIVFLLYLLSTSNSLEGAYPIVLLVLCAYLGLYFFYNYNRNKRLASWGIRPSYICLIGLIVVNLQFYIDQAFCGISVKDLLEIGWVGQYLDKCFFAGCTFILVFLIADVSIKKLPVIKGIKSEKLYIPFWLTIQFLLFIGFIVTIDVATFISGSAYLDSGASDASAGISNSMERLYRATAMVVLALYTKKFNEWPVSVGLKSYVRGISIIYWVPLSLYIILRLFSGDRGPVIYSILAVVYSYLLVSRKTINLKWSLGLIVGGAFGVTLLGVVRSRSVDLNFAEKIEQSMTRMDEKSQTDTPSFSPFTKELAGSLRCNFVAIRDVEQDRVGYSLGKYTVLSNLTCFPGTKKEYFKPLGLDAHDFSSAVYLTESYNNGSESYYFGIGSSAFAESYLDWDIWGVMITAYILGLVYNCVDISYELRRNFSVSWLICILQLSSTAIYVSRSSLSQISSNLVSILIIYWLFNYLLQLLNKVKFNKNEKNTVLYR